MAPEHRAGQIGRCGEPDFGIRQMQRGAMREDRTEGGDDGDLEPIQHPCDAESGHHQPMPARPGQAIHALRNVGGDGEYGTRTFVIVPLSNDGMGAVSGSRAKKICSMAWQQVCSTLG